MFSHAVTAAFDRDIQSAHVLVDSAGDAINESRAQELHTQLDNYRLPNLCGKIVHVELKETRTDLVAYFPAEAMTDIGQVVASFKDKVLDPEPIQFSRKALGLEKNTGAATFSVISVACGSAREFVAGVSLSPRNKIKTFPAASLIHETIHVAQRFREPLPASTPVPELSETPVVFWIYDITERAVRNEAEAYSVQLAVQSNTESGAKLRGKVDKIKQRNSLSRSLWLRTSSAAYINYLIETDKLNASRHPSQKITQLLIKNHII